MPRTVQCVVLGKEAEGMDFPPYPGDLGKRIYEGVSKEAWAAWLKHQTMLINEYRLTPVDPKARKYLEEEMEKFLFKGEVKKPDGYVAPEAGDE
ncbi:MAG: oxidative damage protection protein [Thioalkalivibrionaceae bacterium]